MLNLFSLFIVLIKIPTRFCKYCPDYPTIHKSTPKDMFVFVGYPNIHILESHISDRNLFTTLNAYMYMNSLVANIGEAYVFENWNAL